MWNTLEFLWINTTSAMTSLALRNVTGGGPWNQPLVAIVVYLLYLYMPLPQYVVCSTRSSHILLSGPIPDINSGALLAPATEFLYYVVRVLCMYSYSLVSLVWYSLSTHFMAWYLLSANMTSAEPRISIMMLILAQPRNKILGGGSVFK